MNTLIRSELLTTDSQWLDSISALFTTNMRKRELPKRVDVLHPDSTPQSAFILLKGYAGRYRLLSDGRRLITMILVPGDIISLGSIANYQVKRTVTTLAPCRIGELSCDTPPDNTSWPGLTTALIRHMQRDEAIAEERMLSLGRRNAVESLAHLFCELRERLATVGLVTDDSFELTISQEDLADSLGVTPVHVNRSLRALRKTGLITLAGGNLIIHDRQALELLAHFDSAYLQFEPERSTEGSSAIVRNY